MIKFKHLELGLLLWGMGLPSGARCFAETARVAQTIPAQVVPGSTLSPPSLQPDRLQLLLDRLLALSSAPAIELPGLGGANSYLPSPEAEAKLHLVISLAERRVYVYDRDKVRTSFPVAIGRGGWETPTGKFQVMEKIVDPAWQHPFTGEVAPPGADNPLGSRWIGFWTDGSNFIGFHGTPNPESVGTPASHGCIRMFDKDVIALFEMVQVGTPVEVVQDIKPRPALDTPTAN
jgi:lipoprotein-anchoring transpeptidase ErfK/SrfK